MSALPTPCASLGEVTSAARPPEGARPLPWRGGALPAKRASLGEVI